MDDKSRMPKLNVQTDGPKLSQAQLDYMRIVEQQNRERVAKLKKLQRNNLLTGLALASGVFGIYAYSMLAVKQENFLDELDEKKK